MGLKNIPFGSIIKEGWEKALFGAKFFYFLHVSNTYLITPIQTKGPSMLPTIDLTPTIFFTERISSRFGKIACGDIVVLCSPLNPRAGIVKRVVGMEGDSVTYVSSPKDSDKRRVEEGDSVTDVPSPENCDERVTGVVPKGHVWVQGDYIYNSKDSRDFGPVPYGLIESKIFWKLFPLKDFGPFWKK